MINQTPRTEEEMERWVQAVLAPLKHPPPRSTPAARRGRERYLASVKALQPPVARPTSNHHNGWIITIPNPFSRIAFPEVSTILGVIIAVCLLLGSSVGAVSASQGSMPDQLLYPVKLLSEDTRLMLASNPQNRVQLNLEFMNRRVEEISYVTKKGNVPTGLITNRFQKELDQAFTEADELATETKKVALENLQDNLERHEEQLLKLQEQANPRAAAEFARLVAILGLRLELAEKGIKDPQALHTLMAEQKAQIKELFDKIPQPEVADTTEPKGPEKTDTPGDDKSKEPQLDKTPRPPPEKAGGPKEPEKVPPGQDKKDSDSNDNDKGGKR